MITPSTIAIFEHVMKQYAVELRQIGQTIDREPDRLTDFCTRLPCRPSII